MRKVQSVLRARRRGFGGIGLRGEFGADGFDGTPLGYGISPDIGGTGSMVDDFFASQAHQFLLEPCRPPGRIGNSQVRGIGGQNRCGLGRRAVWRLDIDGVRREDAIGSNGGRSLISTKAGINGADKNRVRETDTRMGDIVIK